MAKMVITRCWAQISWAKKFADGLFQGPYIWRRVTSHPIIAPLSLQNTQPFSMLFSRPPAIFLTSRACRTLAMERGWGIESPSLSSWTSEVREKDRIHGGVWPMKPIRESVVCTQNKGDLGGGFGFPKEE